MLTLEDSPSTFTWISDVGVVAVFIYREVVEKGGVDRKRKNISDKPSVQKSSKDSIGLVPKSISYGGTLPVHYSNQVNCDWESLLLGNIEGKRP